MPMGYHVVSSRKGHSSDLCISRARQLPRIDPESAAVSACQPAQYCRCTRTSRTHVTADTYVDHRRMVAPTLTLSRAVSTQHEPKLAGTVLGISPGQTGARVS